MWRAVATHVPARNAASRTRVAAPTAQGVHARRNPFAEPDSLHAQFFVHAPRSHRPLPEQSSMQLLPGHERLAGPEESAFTVQPPAGQEKVHGPLPWQMNSQPAAGHDSEQGSEVTQRHGVPGTQWVELVVCVVAMQATSRAKGMGRARRRMGARVLRGHSS